MPINHRAKLGRAAMKALRARNLEREIRAGIERMLAASLDSGHPRHRTARIQIELFQALYRRTPTTEDAPRLARERFARKAHHIVGQYGEHCSQCHRELGPEPPVIERGETYCTGCRPVREGRWQANVYREFACPGCGRTGWVAGPEPSPTPHCCSYCRSLASRG